MSRALVPDVQWVLAALALALAAAAADSSLETAWARLARGDAAGAEAALDGVAEPGDDRAADRTAWLDARARIAWARGQTDLSFALAMRSVAVAERARVNLPDLAPAIGPGRPWIEQDFRLPLRTLPTGDAGAQAGALAQSLLALPEARRPDGAWLVWAARLLDASVKAPGEVPGAVRDQLPGQRARLLQAACEARHGARAVTAMPSKALVAGSGAEGFARWFQAEALAREGERQDARLASLRFVQAAAAFDESPWLRVAALRRAADTLQTTDPAEAARLRDAADKETP